MHTLIATIPDPLRKVLLAAYIGTGCDYLSRIGIKHGAFNAIPRKFLHGFGLTPLSDDVRKLAEQYLVNVVKRNASEKSFDELRCSVYRSKDEIFSLPPTSHSVLNAHITRWWFLVNKLSKLLDNNYNADPEDYMWIKQDGKLLPVKELLLIPDELYSQCGCKSANISKRCVRRNCTCKKKTVVCTKYCQCKAMCGNSAS